MIYMIWAILIGVLFAIQAATNTALRIELDSPWIAALTNFTVGLLALFIIILIIKPDTFSAMKPMFTGQVPIWKMVGGLIGAFFVVSVTVLAPQLGIGKVIILYLFGQIIMSIIVDHFGLFGMPMDRITVQKALGIALLIGGVILTQKK
ncbi:MAG: DMT family transporter [Bacteroidales bacterium]|nr:DMT family transporter [Bacteroidales bacterium]